MTKLPVKCKDPEHVFDINSPYCLCGRYSRPLNQQGQVVYEVNPEPLTEMPAVTGDKQ